MRKASLLLVILALVASAASGCLITGRTTGSPPITMPPVVTDSTDDLLRALDAAIAVHHPDLVRSLRPGISTEELERAEADLGLPIHPDLAALYRWHNGLEDDRELFPGHGFFPLEDAVRLNFEIRESPFNILLMAEKNWLVLFPDPAGDGYYYDPSRTYSAGGVFYTFREDNYYRYFPSLKNLLSAVIEMYKEGLLPYEVHLDEFDVSDQIAREEEILGQYGVEVVIR